MNTQEHMVERPPVVVVVGHIDHGKSTLLDYIRKTNTVADEAGGITQHMSAYEVEHNGKKITFLDTPGHQAFSHMRARGCQCADVAILVVAADDGVKPQTIEALNEIRTSGIPFVVAINKIDKPDANPEKTKSDLAEHEIYLEGYGGNISYGEISAKEGTGIDELLDIILLTAEFEELRANPSVPASGLVIESHLDAQRGISATIVIQNGTMTNQMFVVAETSMTKARIMENFLGETITEAQFSAPIRIVGFDSAPPVGAPFRSFATKKEAEAYRAEQQAEMLDSAVGTVDEDRKRVPIILKTDTLGTKDAIVHELSSISIEGIVPVLISHGIGAITESDTKRALADTEAIIIGFNVGIDSAAQDAADQNNITIATFSIIYELTQWLTEILEKRRPLKEIEEVQGELRVRKVFSTTKRKHVIGGTVEHGTLERNNRVDIYRRDNKIGTGTIIGLQEQKVAVERVQEGRECGALIDTEIDIAPGDICKSVTVVVR